MATRCSQTRACLTVEGHGCCKSLPSTRINGKNKHPTNRVVVDSPRYIGQQLSVLSTALTVQRISCSDSWCVCCTGVGDCPHRAGASPLFALDGPSVQLGGAIVSAEPATCRRVTTRGVTAIHTRRQQRRRTARYVDAAEIYVTNRGCAQNANATERPIIRCRVPGTTRTAAIRRPHRPPAYGDPTVCHHHASHQRGRVAMARVDRPSQARLAFLQEENRRQKAVFADGAWVAQARAFRRRLCALQTRAATGGGLRVHRPRRRCVRALRCSGGMVWAGGRDTVSVPAAVFVYTVSSCLCDCTCECVCLFCV
eukprot:m.1410928 g.1410928  ORF g.1410928 m.1410928 type:complete len:311 (+) comp25027_c1_seq23:3902-4834(+)